ncbi:ATP-binding protein [Agrobacterium sp. CG674]
MKPHNWQARYDILEILEDRDGYRSTIITIQRLISAWHDFAGHSTYAQAILDRLGGNAQH